MPTLDWLNRAAAFTTAAQVPYRLLEQVSVHTPGAEDKPTPEDAQLDAAPLQAELLPVYPEPVDGNGASDVTRLAPTGITDNLLIQGDNLEALKALLPFYRGQVKCIFIDPPYNTQSAFEHYDDNLEHAQWLNMMLPRLKLLRELLRDDGSIWVTIDDNEGHYLKVLMDEVFGRGNFVANVVWQKKYAVASDAKGFSDFHDHIYVYSKAGVFCRNLLPRTDKQDSLYKHDDNDGNGPWRTDNLSVKTYAEAYDYPLKNPTTGKEYWPPKGRCWYTSVEKMAVLLAKNGIYFGKDGTGAPQLKRYLARVQGGVVPSTWWTHEDAGHNDESRKESKVLFQVEDPFSTPKPERLLQRILNIATNPNDLVLDSFLGSGTTAAVAHKMGRRWIGIEMGDHAATHCLPRLQKVIDGEQGGISKAVGWGVAPDGGAWRGGGGFRFMRLGAPVFDARGRIHPDVRFATLAAFVWQQETGSAWPTDNTSSTAHPRGAASEPAGVAWPGTPYLGTHYTFDSCFRNENEGFESISYIKTPQFSVYLLFNGILKDKRPASGNVLTQAVLDALLVLHAQVNGAAANNDPTPPAAAPVPLLVYGEACRLGLARLKLANVSFKHIPYDVKAR